MNRTPVSSSNLHSVAYDAESRTLEIEFNSGPVYEYFDVPQSVYEELMAAASHGEYFAEHIKDVYTYQEIQ